MEEIRDRISRVRKELDALGAKVQEVEKETKEWPQRDDWYWSISKCGTICEDYRSECSNNIELIRIRNVSKTEKEALHIASLLEWLVEVPDRWESIKIWRMLEIMSDGGEWHLGMLKGTVTITSYYNKTRYGFSSKELAQNCIDIIGEERLKKYWFGVAR